MAVLEIVAVSFETVKPDLESVCRSVRVNGRRTSIRMEREFWSSVDYIRNTERISQDELLDLASQTPGAHNLTAALKAYVNHYMRQHMTPPSRMGK